MRSQSLIYKGLFLKQLDQVGRQLVGLRQRAGFRVGLHTCLRALGGVGHVEIRIAQGALRGYEVLRAGLSNRLVQVQQRGLEGHIGAQLHRVGRQRRRAGVAPGGGDRFVLVLKGTADFRRHIGNGRDRHGTKLLPAICGHLCVTRTSSWVAAMEMGNCKRRVLAFLFTPLVYSISGNLTSGKPNAMNAILNLLNNIVFLINLALFIYVVLDVLIHFDILNRSNALVLRVHQTLSKLLEPMLNPIRKLLRKYLPQVPIDLSPVVLILLLNFLMDLLYDLLFTTPTV
ncbi:MAG: hypothetical protein DI582_01240 [Azospirillum brasilense]|nr:MAG: hypothetical protein DI582_01240 [Azospirillum brasilense]